MSSTTAAKLNPVRDALHAVKTSELASASGDGIVTLSSKLNVEQAVKLLADKKIQSAPVVDDDDNGKCIGLLDVLDVLYYVFEVSPDPLSLKENELRTLEIAGRAISLVPSRRS
jgi:CBS domain-containing protein